MQYFLQLLIGRPDLEYPTYIVKLCLKKKSILAIHIVPFRVFVIVVLSALVTNFLIWKDLVISSTTSNKRLANGEGIIRLADAQELVVICYKQ